MCFLVYISKPLCCFGSCDAFFTFHPHHECYHVCFSTHRTVFFFLTYVSINPSIKWFCSCLCITGNAHSKCVCVCVSVFRSLPGSQPASSVPVGGGVSSPDTGCLYYSVYYWHGATQLSSDLWIGMVCTLMSGFLVPAQRHYVWVSEGIFKNRVCASARKRGVFNPMFLFGRLYPRVYLPGTVPITSALTSVYITYR